MLRYEQRWYNGTAWTADVSHDGQRFVDPLGIEPGSGPGGTPPSDGSSGSGNRAATAAMALGIAAITTAWLPFVVAFGAVAAVLALVLGWVGLRRSGPSGDGRSRAIVGLITGACGLVAAVIGVVLSVVVVTTFDRYLNPAPNEAMIVDCDLAGSRAVATGTIENLSDESEGFSILVGFVRPDTDNPHRTQRIEVDEVRGGEVVEFVVEQQVERDEIDCVVLEVNGPLPFGLEVD